MESFLHLHLLFRHFPVQLHLGKPCPPPMLSALAAVLTPTSFSMFTSSGFRKEVNVGENWFRLNRVSRTPVEQPNLGENQEVVMKQKHGFTYCLNFMRSCFATCTSHRPTSPAQHISGWGIRTSPYQRPELLGGQSAPPLPPQICASTSPASYRLVVQSSVWHHPFPRPWKTG